MAKGNTTDEKKPRFGIGEWFGKSVVKMTVEERKETASKALNHQIPRKPRNKADIPEAERIVRECPRCPFQRVDATKARQDLIFCRARIDCVAITPNQWSPVVNFEPQMKVMNATTIFECQTLDVKSSASELGVCEETVRRLVRRKVLHKLPGLRRILISKSELQRYLSRGNEV